MKDYGSRNSFDLNGTGSRRIYNNELNDITNINACSGSFDFLENEPDLYGRNVLDGE